jgi:methionyl-tRNA synthetase
VAPSEDSDFTYQKFEEAYNADLANGLGNLVSRVAKLCEQNSISIGEKIEPDISQVNLDGFEFNLALENIWKVIKNLDVRINNEHPWNLSQAEAVPLLEKYSVNLLNIAYLLRPFLPDTAEKIEKQFGQAKIRSDKPLFPRL